MSSRSKFFLVLALAMIAASFVHGVDNLGGGILRPLGAVMFIIFFIDLFIGREVALYDQEERAKQAAAPVERKGHVRSRGQKMVGAPQAQ